jgi:DNA repair exonuclease SbcCD ATPase subunit
MNPTITKLEKRVNKLERMLEEIIETYNDAGAVHSPRQMESKIKKATTMLGMDPDKSDPCPICKKPFKTCGHF